MIQLTSSHNNVQEWPRYNRNNCSMKRQFSSVNAKVFVLCGHYWRKHCPQHGASKPSPNVSKSVFSMIRTEKFFQCLEMSGSHVKSLCDEIKPSKFSWIWICNIWISMWIEMQNNYMGRFNLLLPSWSWYDLKTNFPASSMF